MLVGVLGPVVAGSPLERRDRAALAILVLHRGRTVSVERLADGVWSDNLPASWRKQVQIIVGRLRKVLGAQTIETQGEAYRLTVGSEATDVGVFERLIRDGRRHLADDDPQRAVVDLGRALEMWRGTPYAELVDWEPAQPEVSRLGELHVAAEEDLVEALMTAGENAEAVSRAVALVGEQPLRERRWALLARAHFGAGHQGDALATLRKARAMLVEELGVDPSADLADLEIAMLRQDPNLTAGEAPVAAASPWPGLRAYDEEDAEVFFGREADIAECVDRLLAHGLLVLAGASGSGKSSLVRAGILPELGRRGFRTAVVRPSDDAVESALRSAGTGVVALDQFEEAFADEGSSMPPEVLLAAAVGAVTAGGHVIVVIRGDHVGRLAVDAGTARLVQRGFHLLGPLSGEGMRRAIEGPAERVGVRCGPGLVEMLIRDAEGEPGALPLLSHALAETWARRSGPVLTVEDYLGTGGLQGAVARTAEQAFEALGPDQQRLARSVLLRLVALTDEGVPVRRRLPVGALVEGADRADVVARLVAARLLTVEDANVVISHEALTRSWPRLRDWLAEDANRLQLLRRLESDAAWWDAEGRPDDRLYRGATLQVVSELTATAEEVEDPDAAFLAASVALAERGEREVEQRARAMTRRNRGLVALLVLAVVAGVLANVGRLQAVAAERRAAIEALVTASRAVRPSDRGLAALLAVQAYREDPGPLTHSALLSLFTAESRFAGELYLPGSTFEASAIPGTSSAFVVQARVETDDHESLAVVDLGTGVTREIFADRAVRFWGAQVAVSGDGSVGVVSQYQTDYCAQWDVYCSALTVLDLRTGAEIIGPLMVPFAVSDLALNRDGSLVAAAANESGRVTWWNTSDGQVSNSLGLLTDDEVERWAGGPWDMGSILFTDDGALLATDRGGNVRAIDPTGNVPDRVAVVPAGFAQTNLELAGSTLVTSGPRGVAAVDLRTMSVLWAVPTDETSEPCAGLAVSDYTERAYCGTPAGSVEVLDLATGKPTAGAIAAQHGVASLAAVDGGRELVVFGGNRPVISRWRLDGTGPVTSLVAEGRTLWEGWGSDGRSILVADTPMNRADAPVDGTDFSVWDTTRDAEVVRLTGAPHMDWAGPGLVSTEAVHGEGGLVIHDLTGRVVAGTPPIGYHWPGEIQVFTTQGGSRAYLWNGFNRVSRLHPDGTVDAERTFKIDGEVTAIAVTDTASGDRVVLSYLEWRTLQVEHVVFSGTGDELVRAEPAERLTLAAVSPDGTLVGASPGRITRFDLDTFEPLARFPAAQGQVHALQFSAAGDLLLAAGEGEVALYDVGTGTRIGDPISTPTALVSEDLIPKNGFLHQDGDRLAVASLSGVQVWDIDPERLVEAACGIAGRNLSESEWSNHLGAFGPYEETCPAP